jgi:hypothetical protein
LPHFTSRSPPPTTTTIIITTTTTTTTTHPHQRLLFLYQVPLEDEHRRQMDGQVELGKGRQTLEEVFYHVPVARAVVQTHLLTRQKRVTGVTEQPL